MSIGQNLAGDGDDAASRGVASGGEEEILGFRVPTAEEGGAISALGF
jgi:hypothetical protein